LNNITIPRKIYLRGFKVIPSVIYFFNWLPQLLFKKGKKHMRKKNKFSFKNLIIFMTIIYVGYIVVSTQISMNKIKAEVNVKQQEFGKVQEKNQKLQDEVNMSKTDAYYEKLARERLGLVKPGEAPVTEKK
jgi:cell division protein FtsB